ncbi:hypothetical protein BDV98DRAFT_598205 [Pterulicium gracile]|uniref:Uncharacterized protein n=1 Tax=Pterulicium gracile TaxID=1884261 RepID=A0A5C3Q1I5_9AGAR|nr:hypothetical protein BDV98DRAFT_598205 [Pterula gracilis]
MISHRQRQDQPGPAGSPSVGSASSHSLPLNFARSPPRRQTTLSPPPRTDSAGSKHSGSSKSSDSSSSSRLRRSARSRQSLFGISPERRPLYGLPSQNDSTHSSLSDLVDNLNNLSFSPAVSSSDGSPSAPNAPGSSYIALPALSPIDENRRELSADSR